jgi:ketosteroid isomerase-like protein
MKIACRSVAGDPNELIEAALRAYGEEGVEGMLPYVHPEFTMTTTPDIAAEPDTYEGHDGLRRYFGSFLEVMDEVRIEPTEIEPRGDSVRMEFDLVAIGKATGIEVRQQGHAIWELDDDLLRRVRFFRTSEEARSAFDEAGS